MQKVRFQNYILAKKDIGSEKLPLKLIDESVCLSRVRKYMSRDAWAILKTLTERMKTSKKMWYCKYCSEDIAKNNTELPSLVCDSCLMWTHLNCTTLKAIPE